ncbi:hypothetical protein [Streptodolium elevatio]
MRHPPTSRGKSPVAGRRFRPRWAECRVARQDFGGKRINHVIVGVLALDAAPAPPPSR